MFRNSRKGANQTSALRAPANWEICRRNTAAFPPNPSHRFLKSSAIISPKSMSSHMKSWYKRNYTTIRTPEHTLVQPFLRRTTENVTQWQNSSKSEGWESRMRLEIRETSSNRGGSRKGRGKFEVRKRLERPLSESRARHWLQSPDHPVLVRRKQKQKHLKLKLPKSNIGIGIILFVQPTRFLHNNTIPMVL